MERLHAIVTGRVQGVGFRYHTTNTARQLGLNGWVKNLPDQSVEVVAEGNRQQLEVLVDFLKQGPSSARVQNVQYEWQPATNEFTSFGTRY